MATTILLVFAFVFFVLAALWGFWAPAAPPRPNLIAAGLACWVLSTFVHSL